MYGPNYQYAPSRALNHTTGLGIRHLLVDMVEVALDDYWKLFRKDKISRGDWQRYLSAKGWLFGEDDEDKLSFQWLCGLLGLNRSYLLRGIKVGAIQLNPKRFYEDYKWKPAKQRQYRKKKGKN